jgi:hypothetical protein
MCIPCKDQSLITVAIAFDCPANAILFLRGMPKNSTINLQFEIRIDIKFSSIAAGSLVAYLEQGLSW